VIIIIIVIAENQCAEHESEPVPISMEHKCFTCNKAFLPAGRNCPQPDFIARSQRGLRNERGERRERERERERKREREKEIEGVKQKTRA
jgi:hypothetical protein